jgi:hypothetical protein
VIQINFPGVSGNQDNILEIESAEEYRKEGEMHPVPVRALLPFERTPAKGGRLICSVRP